MRVVMQKCDSWTEQMAFYRFWNNENVSEAGLIGCAIEQCNAQIPDIEEVLLIQDTTDFNLEKHRGRIVDKKELGVIGNDNNNLGFLCHPTIVVNPADISLLGLADIYLWSRKEKPKKEKEESVPQEEKAIEWKLYTTHIVNDMESAVRIINYYKCRWMIEDLSEREG
jgi:hypothetical protein